MRRGLKLLPVRITPTWNVDTGGAASPMRRGLKRARSYVAGVAGGFCPASELILLPQYRKENDCHGRKRQRRSKKELPMCLNRKPFASGEPFPIHA